MRGLFNDPLNMTLNKVVEVKILRFSKRKPYPPFVEPMDGAMVGLGGGGNGPP